VQYGNQNQLRIREYNYPDIATLKQTR